MKLVFNHTYIKYSHNNRYASDENYDTKAKMFGYGRVSNATIESFFKILKNSILRRQTNLRPGEFLLKLYATTKARLKAKECSINQNGSKRRGRSAKKAVDATAVVEKWKNKGTKAATRNTYFTKFIESTLSAKDIRGSLREKLE